MENILSSLQMELPDGEVKSSIDEALEKMNSIGIDTESDPFSVSDCNNHAYFYTLFYNDLLFSLAGIFKTEHENILRFWSWNDRTLFYS